MNAKGMLRGASATQYDEREGLVALLASGHIRDRSVAIDGGAHVGTWTELMAAAFESVHAFEPSPAFADLEFNAQAWPNAILHNEGLIDEECRVESFHRKTIGKLTGRRVRKARGGPIRGTTIDRLGLDRCGLIKLDIEGSEFPALIGARKTIARCRPFLLVEMYGRGKYFGRTDDQVRELVIGMRYREVWKFHVDCGFAPAEWATA